MPTGRETGRGYLGFSGWACGTTVLLVLLGWLPTKRYAGSDALLSMFAGCGISLFASLAGAVPILRARGKPAREAIVAVMAAMGLRVCLVVILGLAAVLSGWFQVAPLLIWLALSYVVLLVVDTRLAVSGLRASENVEG